MRRIRVAVLLAAIAMATSGCGTIANFSGGHYGGLIDGRRGEPERPPFAYGGLLYDVEMLVKNSKTNPEVMTVIFPLWLVEFGISAGLDTVTLPVVIGMNAKLAYQRATGEYIPVQERAIGSTADGMPLLLNERKPRTDVPEPPVVQSSR